jgi:hypothetical protein
MIRILVTGSRYWRCNDLAVAIVRRMVKRYGKITIVHGGACGVDEAFAAACRELGVDAEPHAANWTAGKIAGPQRNAEMVQSGIDLCVAFHQDLAASKGTKDCVRQALKAKVPVYLIEDDAGVPRRVWAMDARLN